MELTFKNVLSGQLDKKNHGFFLLGLIIYTIVCHIWAIAVFPEPFSFGETWISTLGHPLRNPIGFIEYNIWFVSCGLLLIPHFLYLYRRMGKGLKWLQKIIAVIWIVGTVSFGSIGIVNDMIQPLHDNIAAIAFGGLSGAFILQLLLIIYQRVKGFHLQYFWIAVTILGSIILFWVLLFTIGVSRAENYGDFAPWEWGGFFVLFGAIFGMYIVYPDQIHSDGKESIE
jgi:hypothetical protein